ncbi:MAG: hypothetical protein O2968_07790 [Acidobacteria bacterium]|nr:hypothetical protein [Acidobacteriota bacterium]
MLIVTCLAAGDYTRGTSWLGCPFAGLLYPAIATLADQPSFIGGGYTVLETLGYRNSLEHLRADTLRVPVDSLAAKVETELTHVPFTDPTKGIGPIRGRTRQQIMKGLFQEGDRQSPLAGVCGGLRGP